MRNSRAFAIILILAMSNTAFGKKEIHQWSIGKVLDENRARYFAGMLNNSSSNTTENGTWNGNANSTSFGDTTNTQINGNYSGTTNTSTSGTSIPIYRVYDNLVIEGEDAVYITSERLRWRWSKGVHVAVNGVVRYYVDGRKLHVLDDDNKEHTIEIVKEIKKVSSEINTTVTESSEDRSPIQPKVNTGQTVQAIIMFDSIPAGADIEIDGGFVGNTPSSVNVAPGKHQIAVKKKRFAD